MKVLIVEDSSDATDIIRETFNKSDDIAEAKDLQEAQRQFEKTWPDIVILDGVFPEEKGSLATFMAGRFLNLMGKNIPRDKYRPYVILISGEAEAAERLDEILVWLENGRIHHAMHKGFTDSTNIDFFIGLLRHKINGIREHIALRTPPEEAYKEMEDDYDIITHDSGMLEMWNRVNKAARTNHSVLVQGESGTGKELIARAIFRLSKRNKMPYVKVSAPQITESIEGSALFGHLKGAFTGALKDTEGFLDATHNGSLFLDEVDKLSLGMQTKLLDPIRYGTFTPVGDTEQKKVNVRFIFATSRDLSDLVDKGEFSEELFYRLNRIPISLPPLRERKGDIELLAEFFKEEENSEDIRIEKHLKNEMKRMMWRGNVAELKNHIVTLVTMCGDNRLITLKDARKEFSKEYAPEMLDVNEDGNDVHIDLIPENQEELYGFLTELDTGPKFLEDWKQITGEHEKTVFTVLQETYLREKGITYLKKLKSYLDGRPTNAQNPASIHHYKALLILSKRRSEATGTKDLHEMLGFRESRTQTGEVMKNLVREELEGFVVRQTGTRGGYFYSIKEELLTSS